MKHLNIFFTADQHFFHENIIKYSRRPFANVDEMNDTIIENWNATVGPSDSCYVLGDFTLNDVNYAQEILSLLNGNISVIPSPQDRWASEAKDLGLPLYSKSNRLVRILPSIYEIGMLSNQLVLSHFPQRVWQKSIYGSYHLYGNTHGALADFGYSTDVGVDAWNFTPVSYEQIVKKFSTKVVTEYKIFRRGE